MLPHSSLSQHTGILGYLSSAKGSGVLRALSAPLPAELCDRARVHTGTPEGGLEHLRGPSAADPPCCPSSLSPATGIQGFSATGKRNSLYKTTLLLIQIILHSRRELLLGYLPEQDPGHPRGSPKYSQAQEWPLQGFTGGFATAGAQVGQERTGSGLNAALAPSLLCPGSFSHPSPVTDSPRAVLL